MSAVTKISAAGGSPAVTVTCGNLIRYRCRFYLWKPPGETWPGTTSRKKKIRDVTFNIDHPPTDTFSLGPPGDLRTLSMSWVIDMIVPGGGGPVQYSAEVDIKQDGEQVMVPSWTDEGQVTNTGSIGDDTQFEVTP